MNKIYNKFQISSLYFGEVAGRNRVINKINDELYYELESDLIYSTKTVKIIEKITLIDVIKEYNMGYLLYDINGQKKEFITREEVEDIKRYIYKQRTNGKLKAAKIRKMIFNAARYSFICMLNTSDLAITAVKLNKVTNDLTSYIMKCLYKGKNSVRIIKRDNTIDEQLASILRHHKITEERFGEFDISFNISEDTIDVFSSKSQKIINFKI